MISECFFCSKLINFFVKLKGNFKEEKIKEIFKIWKESYEEKIAREKDKKESQEG